VGDVMTHYTAWDVMTMLEDYIDSNYETYVALIRTAASDTRVPKVKTVEIGNDYTRKGLTKPFIMIDPVRMNIDDETVGLVVSDFNIDVLIAVESFTDEEATKWATLYGDAFVSMVLSDDTLGDEVAHASVSDIEFYPGGTGNTKYVLLNMVLSIETER
jgi:hypothetical protein